jgi:hypothetical protein
VRSCLNNRATGIAAGLEEPTPTPGANYVDPDMPWNGEDLVVTDADLDPVTAEEPLEGFSLSTREGQQPNVQLARAFSFNQNGLALGNVTINDLGAYGMILNSEVIGDVDVTCGEHPTIECGITIRGTPTSVRLEGVRPLSISEFKTYANANTTIVTPINHLTDTRPITHAELQFFPLPQVLLKTGRVELTTPMNADEEAILAYLQAQQYAGVWEQCIARTSSEDPPEQCTQRFPL